MSRLLTAAALVVIGILVAVNVAAGAWSPARWVTADGWLGTDSPTLALDRRGDGLLVWTGCDLSTPRCYFLVQARTRSRRGRLGPILNLSELGQAPAWPRVVSDDDGDALVAWQQHDGHTNWRIAARRVGRSGALGPILTLSPDGAIGNNPEVAIAPGGRGLVVWTEYRPTASAGSWYTVARRVSRNGAVGPPLELGPGSPEWPAIAMDRRGLAVVAWTDHARVVARRIGAHAVSAPRVIASGASPIGGFAMVHAAADRDGDFVISFRSGVRARPRVWVRRWSRSGSLGRSVAVSPPGHYAGFHSSLATDLEGDSVIVWTRDLHPNRIIVYARRLPRRGALGRIVRLGAGDRPDVALDDDGDGVAVWQPPGEEPDAVRGRRIVRGGGFGPVRKIGRDGRVPQVAVTPGGRMIAVWQQHAAPYRIQTASGP